MKNNTMRLMVVFITVLLFNFGYSFAQDQINFVTYGREASVNEGDDDYVQIFFIELSQPENSAVSLQIFDPDCQGEFDSRFGEFNSHFSFRLYGGKGVYSNPLIQKTHPNSYTINEGTMLAELKTNNISEGDSEWIILKEFTPAEGEEIEGKHYFKLVVEGIAGNDANVFNLRINEGSDSEFIKIFNYCPTVRLDERSSPIQLKFIAPLDEPVTFHNFDADNKALYVITPFRSEMKLNSSGEGTWITNGVKFMQIEKENLCALQFGPGGGTVNDATFYIKSDENIVPFILPIEKRISNDRPYITYNIDYTTNCNELVLNASATDTDSDQFTFKWFFDDGQITSGNKTTKIYPIAGTYKATLVAYDNSKSVSNGSYKVISLSVNESPAAIAGNDFTSTPNKSITFSGSRSFDDDGSIISYEWNFGDGTQATGRTTVHAYKNAGRYQAILKVTDNSPGFCNYDLDTVNVWINSKPVAQAGKDIIVSIGEEFSLDAGLSSDVDGSLTNYSWDFKDGNSSDGKIVKHSYSKPGKYFATLKIKDDANAANSISIDEVVVTVNNPPTARAGNDMLVALDEVVYFDANSSTDSDGNIIKYKWDFGDGFSNDGANVNHTYSKPGKYIANLTVLDNSGTSSNTHSDERIITVNTQPVANAGSDVYQTRFDVNFDARGSTDPDGNIVNYRWDFGDGNSANSVSASNRYDKPGKYVAILKVTDNTNVSNNESYDTISVVINAKPIADAGPDLIAAPDESFSLSGKNSIDSDGSIKKYSWMLNGKEFGTSAELEHSFNTPGTYNIQLVVNDNSGHVEAKDTDEMVVTVNAMPIIVADTILYVAPGEEFTLDASRSYDDDDEQLNYEWMFAGEIVSTQNKYSRIFDSPGIRKYSLKLSDNKGAINSSSTSEITVAVNHPPVPKTEREILSCSRIITFDAGDSFDSDGDNLVYKWSIGNEITLTGKTVKHNFKKSGVFPILLSVDDGKGLANSIQATDVKVEINTPPIANAGTDILACSGDVVNLNGSESNDADGDLLKYSWDFGDGSKGEGLSVTKVYNNGGVYVVTLEVTDNSGLECNVDIDTKVITVIESPVAFAGDDLIACTNSEVTFDGSKSTDSDGIVNSFAWDFGDGESSGGQTTTHIYKKPGEYKVLLSISGELVGECDNTDTDELIVTVTDAPFAIFESADSIALGDNIDFDASKAVGNNGSIQSYVWDFGDGAKSTGSAVNHEYKKAGNYTVSLIIETETDSECKTSAYKKSICVNASPVASTKDEYNAVLGESILLDASDSKDADGQITKYVWNLGNGVIKEGIKIRHTFLETGSIDISLTVYDNTNLSNNSDSKIVKVNVKESL